LNWPDIDNQDVGLPERRPAVIEKLSRASERFEASYFFSDHHYFFLQINDDQGFRRVAWMNWASIVALQSVEDVLRKDLGELNLKVDWKRSKELQELNSDPLLTVFRVLRNHIVHVESHPERVRNATWQSQNGTFHGDFEYFIPIDFDSVAGSRRQTDGYHVTPEMIEWFNRQAERLPAFILIGIARRRYADYVARFLSKHLPADGEAASAAGA
jgi:hypothetical protein